ncbi:hypothetical protein Nepgr_023708 [Nepenthes gracilis]|uniref:Uncharacterized protein n=1 Tax=Nepenthes gracilis TaxID=150966 RepID=A0AAD3T2Y7_NEPGR|nr:hypothetical protein Nepgr_023708 [Nepenthes gracilis]
MLFCGALPLERVAIDYPGHGRDSMHIALGGGPRSLARELAIESLPCGNSRQKMPSLLLRQLDAPAMLGQHWRHWAGSGIEETSVLAIEEEEMDVPESAGIVRAGKIERTLEFIKASETGGLGQEPESVEVPEAVGSPVGASPRPPSQNPTALEDVSAPSQAADAFSAGSSHGARPDEMVVLYEQVSVPPCLEDPGPSYPVEESFERSEPSSMEEVAEPAEPPSAPSSGAASHGMGSSFTQV